MKQDKIVYLGTVILGVIGLVTTLFLQNVDSWMIPRMMCILILCLGIAGLLEDIWLEKTGKLTDKDGTVHFKKEEISRFLVCLAWLFGLAIAIYFFGFYISMFVFFGAYLAVHKKKLYVVIVAPVITTAAFYIAFEVLLKTFLFKGILFN